MSLSLADIKRADVQSLRDVAAGLEKMATANADMKDGVGRLPIAGDAWKGVSGDAAHHELDGFGKLLGSGAESQKAAATKIRRAADEFEGVKQLLTKIEQDAAKGKFKIDMSTGKVTPPSGDYDKSELDYLTSTLKQIQAAGEAANSDLAAAVKAGKGLPDPSSAAAQTLPTTPTSAAKPDGTFGALQNLAAPNPDGDPGATKAAAAGADTQANYKEWYPKNAVPVGDKNVDPSKLGGLGAIPGVRDTSDKVPQRMSPTLQPRDVPAFKEATRALLQKQGVPADQIEQQVNAAAERAQTPHFLHDAEPMRRPGEVPLHNSPGDQFNDIMGRASDSATKTVDGQIAQAKILTGQAGPGAPGVAEAWKELGINAAKQAHELTTDPLAAPKMGIEEAKEFYNHPGESIGKNIILGTEALATGGVGGEAAAGARGLLGDLTGAEGRALTHDLPGSHDPLPTAHAPDHPAPQAEHHTPIGDSPDHHVPAADVSPPSTAQIGDWLHEINRGPGMDPFDPARAVNCGQCALAVEQRLSGMAPEATAGHGTLSIPEMEAATGKQQIAATPSEIAKYLVDQGPGSHTVVGVDRAGDMAGHWFNAYYDGKNVWAVDGQTNEILGWPPDMDIPGHPVTHWDMGVPKK